MVVLDSFQNADPTSKTKVLQWVCSQELHQNGEIHYHVAVKLEMADSTELCGQKAWPEIKFL